MTDPYDDIRDGNKANNTSPKINRYVGPALRTVVLSPDVARMYGATTAGRTLAGSQCSAPKMLMMDAAAPYSFRFSLDCTGGNMGGKASVEGFMTFLMKNGYKVKGLRRYVRKDAPDVCNNTVAEEAAGNAGVTFDAPVAVGTNGPYFKAQLWAKGRKGIVACFAMDVEGPFDYSDPGVRTPYHCDKPATGWACETGLRP